MCKASVIIPSYNRGEALERTLQALDKQTLPSEEFEVIVVDDGSTDRSVEIVSSLALPYRMQLLKQNNLGPATARNLGARCAQGEILIFLDSDMIAEPGLVQEHVLAHERRPGSIVMGRVRVWTEANRSLFDQIARVEETRDLGPDPISLAFYHVVSCNLSLQRDRYAALGGFDETYREAAAEDTELGYRADNMGMPLVYWPAASAYHNHPRSLPQRCAQVRSMAFWTARLLQKHSAIAPLLPIYQDILPIVLGQDSLALVARKLGRRALALTPTRKTMALLIHVLENRWPNPVLLRSLNYKLMSGYRVEGFREGQRRPA